MATYSFDTITAAQALAITATDSLSFGAGAATLTSVAYNAGGTITITVGARGVEFGAPVAALAQQALFTFADGSRLYVGDGLNNAISIDGDTHPGALFGGDGGDTLNLGSAGGVAQGNQGNDILKTAGQATLYGGQGDDTFFVAPGGHGDFLQGNKGDDAMQGGSSDTILGGQGNDTITGSGFLNGNLGNDKATGGGQLFGEGGNDTLIGTGSGHNALSGGDGDDSLVAAAGGDTVSGDAGNDTIDGSGAADVISGGAGADVFRFLIPTAPLPTAAQVPQILDWSSEDRLSLYGLGPPSTFGTTTAVDFNRASFLAHNVLSGGGLLYYAVQVGADTFVFSTAGGSNFDVVELVGRTLADISSQNFI